MSSKRERQRQPGLKTALRRAARNCIWGGGGAGGNMSSQEKYVRQSSACAAASSASGASTVRSTSMPWRCAALRRAARIFENIGGGGRCIQSVGLSSQTARPRKSGQPACPVAVLQTAEPPGSALRGEGVWGGGVGGVGGGKTCQVRVSGRDSQVNQHALTLCCRATGRHDLH
jgi:hypothetical protein